MSDRDSRDVEIFEIVVFLKSTFELRENVMKF
jgi:hypothetical protein